MNFGRNKMVKFSDKLMLMRIDSMVNMSDEALEICKNMLLEEIEEYIKDIKNIDNLSNDTFGLSVAVFKLEDVKKAMKIKKGNRNG